MKKKSLAINAMLSSIRTLANLLFPLITYRYIAGILSVEDLGRINFGQSIISYFLLLAGLGITTFATRNGSQIRENRVELAKFANRVFSINLFSMLVSYSGLVILLLLPTKVADYRDIIMIQGIAILASPFAVDWLYNVEEDFGYITIRSIVVQLISFILMFILVKKREDIYIYITITTLASCFANTFNFVHARKYVKIKVVVETRWKEYRKSILTFFANSISSIVYLSSDVTLLGVLSTDYAVGLYGMATKIYSIVKQMFNAIVGTMLPRLAFLQKNNEDEYFSLAQTILNIVFAFVMPAMVGLVILREDVLLIISNEEYLPATKTLVILTLALFFATLANVLVSGILICSGREKKVALATMISAIENVFLNMIFIPMWNQDGAAFTTLLAEMTVCVLAAYNSKDILKKIMQIKELLKSIISCGAMALFLYFVKNEVYNLNIWFRIIIIIGAGIILFGSTMIVLRSEMILKIVEKIKRKI